MKTFPRVIGQTILMGAILFTLGVIFVYSGRYNVAATSRHTKPVEQILRLTLMRSVVVHAREVHPPADYDPQSHVLAERGAGHYQEMCRTCHGAPGRKPDPWQLYPPAPDLADALRVTRWSDAEVFWIIKNGIKDTGMSAFGQSHDDDDLWALTAFVRQLQSITAEQYQAMTERAPMNEGSGHEGQNHASEPAQPHKH